MAGLYFEDFKVGTIYRHEESRSVTQFDNIWHTCMTLNTQPLHLNNDFADRKGIHKKPLFNSMYTLGIVLGQTVTDLTRGTLLSVILLTDIEFPRSVFDGDTLYSRTTVLGLEDSGEEPDAGIVEFFHEGLNQANEVIATCKRKVLVRKRGTKT